MAQVDIVHNYVHRLLEEQPSLDEESLWLDGGPVGCNETLEEDSLCSVELCLVHLERQKFSHQKPRFPGRSVRLHQCSMEVHPHTHIRTQCV
jgi:hypothetical protein